MQYFFHVTLEGLRSNDMEGQDFETFDAAYAEGVENGRSVVVEVIRQGGYLAPTDTIEITDVDGHVLARLVLEDIIKRPAKMPALGHGDGPGDLAQAVRDVAGSLLSECIAATEADLGNVQIMDWHTGCLAIRAQQGFGAEFLDHFAAVRLDDGSVCSHVLRSRKSHVVSDVARDPSLKACAHVLERAGVKAVQSTPLLSSHGLLVGVVSTHFGRPAQPNGVQLQAVSTAARKAADAILRLRAEIET